MQNVFIFCRCILDEMRVVSCALFEGPWRCSHRCSALAPPVSGLCRSCAGIPALPGLPQLRTPLFLPCVLGAHELRWWGRVAARAPVWTSSLREPISLSLIPATPQCATQGLKEVGGRKKKPKGGKCMGSVLADSI